MKERLDKALVQRGLARTRSQAQVLIERGAVRINGILAQGPAAKVSAQDALEVLQDEIYVGRGAYKLERALEAFASYPLPIAGATVLDVGASTGGFTQVLLKHGAAQVYAVDVGTGQLAPELARDPRVVDLQGHDVRELPAFPRPPDFAVVDVSFISILKVLPAIEALIAPNAPIIALIKPQFEAGRERLGKGGLVRDAETREQVLREVLHQVKAAGRQAAQVIESPIQGKDGNTEYLALLICGR